MNKAVKTVAAVGAGILVAAGAVVLADRYLGHNYLGSPTGKVVGRCFKNGKFYLYVKRLNRIDEVEVDRDTCLSVNNGDIFNMASAGAKLETRRRAQPEEVLNAVPDEEELASMFAEEPVCDCVGTCKGEHLCAEDCACVEGECDCTEGECQCGDECHCAEA